MTRPNSNNESFIPSSHGDSAPLNEFWLLDGVSQWEAADETRRRREGRVGQGMHSMVLPMCCSVTLDCPTQPVVADPMGQPLLRTPPSSTSSNCPAGVGRVKA